jgi:putative flippase GtrA
MVIKELKKDIYRYIKFLIGGSISLIINLIITYVLTEYLNLWHMLSFSIALGVEIVFLFAYHSFITFNKKGRVSIFIIIILIISGMNWIAVYFLSIIIGIQYLIAIILSAGAISIINYLLNKNFAFNV